MMLREHCHGDDDDDAVEELPARYEEPVRVTRREEYSRGGSTWFPLLTNRRRKFYYAREYFES